MRINIHTLNENTALYGFLGEWGLSFHIDTGDYRILFDCGMTDVAVRNAQKLGVDLKQIDCVVISHGHADHTGGLREILKVRGSELPIIAHPDIWQPKYAVRGGGRKQYIGIPYLKEELESLGARFELEREAREIFPNIFTSGEVRMETDYELVDDNLVIAHDGDFLPDPLADDQALFLKTENGLVVILGCAHRGLINTLRQAVRTTGQSEIQTAIGGTHLVMAKPERIEKSVTELKGFGLKKIGACHCTGNAATSVMARELGAKFFPVNSGQSISLF